MAWWEFYKLWNYQFEKGPLEKLDSKDYIGAGISTPDGVPDIRGDGWKGQIRLHDSNDFIDLSTITNRKSRYKEYERLRNVAEIEMAMTVVADEACIASDTRIATLFDGFKTIKWLTERWEKNPTPFLVYCWDFEKEDYALGWAHEPRVVKMEKTLKFILNDGTSFVVTKDHRMLDKNQKWVEAQNLKVGDELMPFFKTDHNRDINKILTKQYPRIKTKEGWINERAFLEKWKNRNKRSDREKLIQKAINLLSNNVTIKKTSEIIGHPWKTIEIWLKKEGFNVKELKWLGKNFQEKKIIAIMPYKELKVYDLSVEKHENFCTDSVVMHNCQKNDEGNIFKINVENQEVKKELEFLCFNRNMLNLNKKMWALVKRLCIFGDGFYELIINPNSPKDGVLKIQELPADSVYKIVTSKGRVVEYQQSQEGPDYQSLTRSEVTKSTDVELQQSTAIRFFPKQVIHMALGDDRKTFYPYGQSLIEPARGPAHQLRLMEDSMMVYRLCLIGETRIRTKEGYKYIKNLSKGDHVFSYNLEKECVSAKVINFVNNGIKDVYKVKSKHIEITGTSTHPILVNRKGITQYVDIQDLIPGEDKLINVSRNKENLMPIPKIAGEKWAKLDFTQRTAFRNSIYKNRSKLIRKCGFKENRVKQFLYSENKALPYDIAVNICEVFDLNPEKLIITSKNQINPERISLPDFVDENFARLFGFLIGDGSIRKNQYQLYFAAGVNQEQNLYYSNLLKKYFGEIKFISDKRRKNKALGAYVVSSQEACKILIKMGYIPGAKNKRIPDWVFTSSKEIRKAFVEGLSDADGCERFTEAETWFSTIELCNKQLVEDIKEIWASIGLCSGKIIHRKRNGGHEIEKGRKIPPTESYSVTIVNKELPEYENVLSVEHMGQEEVYDITVDNEIHNFIANSTCVHNTRAPERRIFYVDVGSLPPFKAEAFVERLKDQFRKKKVATGRAGTTANSIEERWHAPAADEDYWMPIRPNSNTRIETLPGAQNLGEIDDALYFRNKLFTALNFPKNYFNSEDANATRITLSAQDARFARMIERIQSVVEDGILELCERHLEMRGFPSESYENLKINMTPPSAWKELSEAEVLNNRMNMITTLKGSMIMSDYDLLTKFMKLPANEVEEIISRNKIQKLEDLKIQVIGQNPQLLGIGTPSAENPEEPEMGTDSEGPNPMLSPEETGEPKESDLGQEEIEKQPTPQSKTGSILPDFSDEDAKKYDLEIQDYDKSMDREEIDWSEES